jgi:uncharacterized protein (DUF4415 family)
MEKEKVIRRFSETELEERRARGESRTDLARVRTKTAEELERDIASDPDFSGVPEDWYKSAEAVMPTPKKLLSLRLDSDVVDWFKKQGPGYQTRINAVLRAFVQQTVVQRSVWGADDLTRFLQMVNNNQKASVTKYSEPYGLLQRINDCFSKAGKNLVISKSRMTGPLFLRSQYAYKTAAGMALAGQVVEAFVMMRSCLEYAGYALLISADPSLDDVFLRRHFDTDAMKDQKQKFRFSEIKAVIGKFDPELAEIFQEFYDRSINFGAHPNPSGVLSAVQCKYSDDRSTLLNLALSADEKMLLHAMKCTAQVGLASLCISQHIFKDRFENLGISAEIALLKEYL